MGDVCCKNNVIRARTVEQSGELFPRVIDGACRVKAVAVCAAGGIAEVLPCSVCTVTVAYPLYSIVQTLLRDFGAETDNAAFSESVTLTARLLPESVEPFKAALADATGGKAAFALTGEGEITVRHDAE